MTQALSKVQRFHSLPAEPLLGWRDVMERLRPKIQTALDLGDNTYSFDNLVLAVEKARLKLFYRGDAVLFAEIVLFPQYATLNFMLSAGSFDGVLQLEEAARAWGEAMGCAKVWFSGRPGWTKVAIKRGWTKRPQVVFWKDLIDE